MKHQINNSLYLFPPAPPPLENENVVRCLLPHSSTLSRESRLTGRERKKQPYLEEFRQCLSHTLTILRPRKAAAAPPPMHMNNGWKDLEPICFDCAVLGACNKMAFVIYARANLLCAEECAREISQREMC
jgi:hypothetical protein